MAKSENKNFYQLYCEFRCIKTQYLIMESWQILHLYLAWGMGSCSLSLPLSLSLKFTDPQSIWIAGCKIKFVPTVKHHDFVYFYLKPINNVPIPVPAPLWISSWYPTKWDSLQQNDMTSLFGPFTPSSFTFNPTPNFGVSCLTARHPMGQPFSLWEKDFITEKNCGIVSPQLPLLTGEGGACLDTGASWSDLASGVSSLTVWKASHVTHHWVTAPSPQSRTLSQPNKHQCTEQHSTYFAILYESHVRTEILYHYLCGQFSFLAEVVKALVSLMTQRVFEFFLLLHLKM